MAISKFYLKRDATTVSGTLVGTSATVSATTPTYIGAAGNLSESMTSVISTANHTSLTLSVPGNLTVARSGLIARWYSDPVAAQTFSSQTITVSIAVQENNLDSNYQFTWVLAVWRPSTGTLVGRIWDQVSAAAEPATTGVTAVTLGTGGSSSSVTAQAGDVLVFEAWRASSVTAATNTRNNLVYFDGTTEGSASNNAAYVQFTNAVLMAVDRPVADTITATDSVVFSTSGNVGTKKFYLHAADHTVPGTFPSSSVSVSASTPTKITTTALAESMDATVGTTQTSVTHVTNNNTVAQSGLIARFVSRPLAAQTFTAQQVDLSVAISQSNNDSNFFPTFVLAVWRPATGAVVGRVFDLAASAAVEATASQAVSSVGGTSTQVAAADGDVLVLEIWRASQAQGSNNARNNVIYYDGTTEGSAASTAATLTFANTVLFKRVDESRPVADTLTSSDVVSAAGTRARSATDSATVADAVAAGVGLAGTVADTGALGDVVAAASAASRTVADTVTVVEDIDAVGPSGNIAHDADISDSVTFTDTMSGALAAVSAATDTLTASEGLSSPGAAARGVTDTLLVTGTATGSVAVARAATDALTASDGLVGPGSSARSVSDAVTVADTVDATTSSTLTGAAEDTATVADTVTATVSVARPVADSVSVSDAVGTLRTVSAGVAGSVSLLDTASALVAAARSISDLVDLADEVDRVAALVAAAVDQVICGSTVDGAGFGISRQAADTVTVADVMSWSAPTTPGELVPVAATSSVILIAAGAQSSAVAAAAAASSASGGSAAEASTVGVTAGSSTATAANAAQATTSSESSTAATMTGA